MILVTNDLHDFARIYQRSDLHPGIVFLRCMDDELMSLETQRHMFEGALEQVDVGEPVNEAILVRLDETADGNWRRTIISIGKTRITKKSKITRNESLHSLKSLKSL